MAVPFLHNNFIVAQNNEILNTLHPQLLHVPFLPLHYFTSANVHCLLARTIIIAPVLSNTTF